MRTPEVIKKITSMVPAPSGWQVLEMWLHGDTGELETTLLPVVAFGVVDRLVMEHGDWMPRGDSEVQALFKDDEYGMVTIEDMNGDLGCTGVKYKLLAPGEDPKPSAVDLAILKNVPLSEIMKVVA